MSETVEELLRDVWDTRELVEMIETLEGELSLTTCDECGSEYVADETCPSGHMDTDYHKSSEAAEIMGRLAEAKALEAEIEPYSEDYRYGSTVIDVAYFVEYAQELAEDIGAISRDAAWPLSYIDWDTAAAALAQDYTLVEFQGREFYVR